MSGAVSLMQALLGPDTSATRAHEALQQALLAEAEPLHWCATSLAVSDAEIMRRAAGWAGLAFFDVVPRLGQLGVAPDRLEHLFDVKLHRVRIVDRDVIFATPDFFGILRLREALDNQPDLPRNLCLVPAPALRSFMVEQAGEALVDSARQNIVRHWPHAAAQLELTRPIRRAFAILLVALTLILLAAPLLGHGGLVPIWLLLVMIPAVLRLAALCMPVTPEPDIDPVADDAELPLYSVLVPLRDEANMVPQLCTSLARIDYPADKLEIIFVVEAASPMTVAAVRQHLGDARFSLLVVPDAAPRTKPKALGFALPMCRGEFLVVYDAEDRPAPDQLRRVAGLFAHQPEVACIQARLVIDNGGRRMLPSLFAGEYAGLFAVLLPALAQWGLVVPLGGTSNHFRTSTLRALGGWDSFNVTEDADLGVRLARRRLRCATCTSPTFEAAPTRFTPWLGQRTRWMKGWMQTYVVHNRNLPALIADLGWIGMLMFQAVLMGMLLAPLLHAGFLFVLLVLVLTGQMNWPLAELWPIACLAVLVIGHGSAIATNLLGLARTGQRQLWVWQALLPAYWLLIGWATLRAVREFSTRPFHWFKTPHSAEAAVAHRPEATADNADAGPVITAAGRVDRFDPGAILDGSPAQ